jgi:hypothetical protein
MTARIHDEFSAKSGRLMTTHVSAFGATVYMNKAALQKLIVELQRISDADPEECYEVHIGRLFSYFLDNDSLETPPVVYHDGLQEILAGKAESAMAKEVAASWLPGDASVTPFEVSIMHVSDDSLRKDAAAAAEDRIPPSSFRVDC